jgi:hypothetical protein
MLNFHLTAYTQPARRCGLSDISGRSAARVPGIVPFRVAFRGTAAVIARSIPITGSVAIAGTIAVICSVAIARTVALAGGVTAIAVVATSLVAATSVSIVTIAIVAAAFVFGPRGLRLKL